MYEISRVSKIYKGKRGEVHAIDDIDLSIEAGEMISIQGPTGGGKSTLLQLLGALDKPTSGSIQIGDKDLAKLSDRQLADLRAEKIGFVFQGFNLIPTLTALENVEMALVPSGISPEERAQRSLAALESVGLGDRATHLPSELSGGQQQRVAIARALVKKPDVLLADEPTGNLDESTRDEIVALLESLWREHGITLIIVTHDSQVARRAQRHLTIKNGKVSETRKVA
jgi:putative ABC transport system ATP-binding protein